MLLCATYDTNDDNRVESEIWQEQSMEAYQGAIGFYIQWDVFAVRMMNMQN